MDDNLSRTLLNYSADKLEQLGGRIVICLDRLTDEQIWWRGGDNQNAIGNLVLHLCGNVRQWIGNGVACQPDDRQRAEEFAERGSLSAELLASQLRETVSSAVSSLRALPEGRLAERVTIQGYEVTLLEVVCHVVEHFAYHTGQILFITKHLTGEDLGFYRHLNQAEAHGEKIP